MEVLFSSGAGAAHTNKNCLLGLFSIVVLAIYVNSCYDIIAINIFIGYVRFLWYSNKCFNN